MAKTLALIDDVKQKLAATHEASALPNAALYPTVLAHLYAVRYG
jgi:hypothetical protein